MKPHQQLTFEERLISKNLTLTAGSFLCSESPIDVWLGKILTKKFKISFELNSLSNLTVENDRKRSNGQHKTKASLVIGNIPATNFFLHLFDRHGKIWLTRPQ